MFDKLKKIFLYGDTDRETFRNIYPNICESSRTNMLVYSLITTVGMAMMYLASYLEESLVKNRIEYIVCTLIPLVLFFIIHKSSKNHHRLIYGCIYVFIALLFAFGIALGTFVEPNEVTVSFPILLFAVPLLFTDSPIRMDIMIVLGIIAYIFAADYTQTDLIFGYNMSNILPYGIISIIVSTYMMSIKIKRIALEYENKYLIESDQLTGLLNRRSYENQIQIYRSQGCPENLLICAFDINGLKTVNDTLGHNAGDEIIRGAASCISEVFEDKGFCYRIGGDEFIAITENPSVTPKQLKEDLDKGCGRFCGSLYYKLSISSGFAASQKDLSIDELIKLADKNLYEDKARYYRSGEHDRRGRS